MAEVLLMLYGVSNPRPMRAAPFRGQPKPSRYENGEYPRQQPAGDYRVGFEPYSLSLAAFRAVWALLYRSSSSVAFQVLFRDHQQAARG